MCGPRAPWERCGLSPAQEWRARRVGGGEVAEGGGAKLNHFRNEAGTASGALQDLADTVETRKGPRGWRR